MELGTVRHLTYWKVPFWSNAFVGAAVVHFFFFHSSIILHYHSAEAFFESSVACRKLSFASSNVGSIFTASVRSLIASWYLPEDNKKKYRLSMFWSETPKANCIFLIRYIRAKSIYTPSPTKSQSIWFLFKPINQSILIKFTQNKG